VVFFATGRKPNTDGLGLEKAGVTVNQNGAVIVNHQRQTQQPHIYAIGDVTDHMNLTPVALGEGHALADTLFGGNPRELSLHNVPSAVFSTPADQQRRHDRGRRRVDGTGRCLCLEIHSMRHNLSGRKRRSTMKLIVDQATQKVVGVHMLGEDAPEIIQGMAIAVLMGATKQDFDRTVGIHPTSAEEFVTMRTRTRVAGVRRRRSKPMHRRSFLAGAAATPLARPSLAAGAKNLIFVPQTNLTSLDPVWTTATVTRNFALMVYEGLYGRDQQFGGRSH